MSVADEIVSKSNGARFYRADLHIHSVGGSHDVKDMSMTPASILQTAERESLTLVSITDHNEITNMLGAIELSKGRPVSVIAGIELSTPQGHLLVYFPDYDRLVNFYGRLQFEGKGTPESRCQTSLLDCLNLASSTGGIGILAHVDGPGGFEAAQPRNTPHKEDVLVHPALLGIELRSAASDISYGSSDPDAERAAYGKRRAEKLGLGEGQRLARVLFSDSHTLAALGHNAQGNKRVTRIKMDKPSFDGLRLAMIDPDARIRLEDEIPTSVPYIMGVKLEGGFLDGQTVHFSRNLTCIIGGRGAGKSTLFEAARSAAETQSESPIVDSEAWPQSLHLVWVDEAGQQQIIRRGIRDQPQNLLDADLGPTRFPIECYGQGETAETSNRARTDPTALLDYLDQFVDFKDLKTQEATCRDNLLSNQTDIEKAKLEVGKIPQYTRSLATTRQQLQALETANAKDVVALERNLAEERTVREILEQKIARFAREARELGALAISAEVKAVVVPAEWKIAGDEYKAFVSALEKFETSAVATRDTLASNAATFAQEASSQLKAWKAKEQQISTKIEAMRKQLATQGIRLDLAYIRKLTSDEAAYAKALDTLNKSEKHLKELQKRRSDLLAARAKLRSAITAARVAFAVKASAQLEGTLGDLRVSVKFLSDGLSQAGEQHIQQVM
jgi:ABC-type cobalamin/Fe3+-siderophores transport system ATPase subunit